MTAPFVPSSRREAPGLRTDDSPDNVEGAMKKLLFAALVLYGLSVLLQYPEVRQTMERIDPWALNWVYVQRATFVAPFILCLLAVIAFIRK